MSLKKSLLFLTALMFSMEAHVSEIYTEEKSLKQLTQESSFILVVNKAEQFLSQEEISILPNGSHYEGKNKKPFYEASYNNDDQNKNKLTKNYPPFVSIKHKFKVVATLKGPTELKANSSITVYSAYFETRLNLHRQYYLEGLSKSPIYFSYAPLIDINLISSGQTLIIFIHGYKDDFQYSLINAYENFKVKDKILKIINSKK